MTTGCDDDPGFPGGAQAPMARWVVASACLALIAMATASGCSSSDSPEGGGGSSSSGGTAGQQQTGGADAGGGNSSSSGAGGSGGELPLHVAEGPSCGGMVGDDCGGQSCCENILLPGGTFPMGRSVDGTDWFSGPADEQPEHDATVAPFYLDTFEVTVGRFQTS